MITFVSPNEQRTHSYNLFIRETPLRIIINHHSQAYENIWRGLLIESGWWREKKPNSMNTIKQKCPFSSLASKWNIKILGKRKITCTIASKSGPSAIEIHNSKANLSHGITITWWWEPKKKKEKNRNFKGV